eukprot:9314808-Pyramimonas_sp.AAC.1
MSRRQRPHGSFLREQRKTNDFDVNPVSRLFSVYGVGSVMIALCLIFPFSAKLRSKQSLLLAYWQLTCHSSTGRIYSISQCSQR